MSRTWRPDLRWANSDSRTARLQSTGVMCAGATNCSTPRPGARAELDTGQLRGRRRAPGWFSRRGAVPSGQQPRRSGLDPLRVTHLGRAEQKLVEVLQSWLNAVQDAAADGAQPLQSLRKGVHQALCPVDEDRRWRHGGGRPPLSHLPPQPLHSLAQEGSGDQHRDERKLPLASRICSPVMTEGSPSPLLGWRPPG